MAKELRRRHDIARRLIVIEMEDDLGQSHHVQLQVGALSCPTCGREYARGENGKVDFQKAIDQVHQQLDDTVDTVIAEFERHGAEMGEYMARRAHNRASPPPAAPGAEPVK